MWRVGMLFVFIALGLLGCSERRPAPNRTSEAETNNAPAPVRTIQPTTIFRTITPNLFSQKYMVA